MSSQTPAQRAGLAPGRATALLLGLLEDAAAVPPRAAGLDEALAAHRALRDGAHTTLVGPLLVPVSRLGELLDALDAAPSSDPLDLVLVADTGLVEAGEARSILLDDVRVEMAGLHVALPADGPLGDVATLTLDTLDIALPAAIEVPRAVGWRDALDVLAADGAERAAFRVGAATPAPHPTEAELAALVVACVGRALGFTLVGDLRRAVRSTDPASGLEEHGVLNVVAATAAALAGADEPEVAAVLAERDAPTVLALLAAPDPATVRRRLSSVGACSIGDVLSDLRTLGLLDDEE